VFSVQGCIVSRKKRCLSSAIVFAIPRGFLTNVELACFNEEGKLGKQREQGLEHAEFVVEAANQLMHKGVT
jgi:hypothetical protein